MLVSIPAVSVWGWRADGFLALAPLTRIYLPPPYPEARGVSVSPTPALRYLMQWGQTCLCVLLSGGEEMGEIWCNCLQEEGKNDCQSHNGINQQILLLAKS